MASVTEAIILNSIKYSETSVIMKCYSQNYGILSFIIKGVRSRKRTKFSLGRIEPLSIVEIEFNRLKKAVNYANVIGLDVHAGHGITFDSAKILSKIKGIKEYNIGHFLIGESIFLGLKKTIKKFKNIIN